jgi:hypothetical protein
VANFSPLMAEPDEVEVQGQNAKPLRNAGVVGSAERGYHCRIGAGGGREVKTRQGAISQRSVTRRDFSDGNGEFPSRLHGLTCDRVSPAELSRSLVRCEPFDRTVGSGGGVLGARETARQDRVTANHRPRHVNKTVPASSSFFQ